MRIEWKREAVTPDLMVEMGAGLGTGPGAALDLLVRDVVFLALSCWVLLSPECPCSADRLLGRDA